MDTGGFLKKKCIFTMNDHREIEGVVMSIRDTMIRLASDNMTYYIPFTSFQYFVCIE